MKQNLAETKTETWKMSQNENSDQITGEGQLRGN